MALTRPAFVPATVADSDLYFVWDDTRADEDFTYDPEDLLARLAPLTLRARIAVAIGMYEWVVWRFEPFCGDPIPIHIAEAAWCANVHRGYMEYFELHRYDWLGPVRGPQWGAVAWLVPMVLFSEERPGTPESSLAYLASLAMHVLPQPALFESWLDGVIPRLLQHYLSPPEDPFEDLFGEREEELRGPFVPREALILDLDYKPENAVALVSRFLANVDYTQNPHLLSRKELIADGFDGTPYSLKEG